MTPTQKAEQEARAICAAIDKLHDDCIGRGFEAFNEGRFIRDQESLITSALLKARADAIEEAAKMCDFERREYEKSSKEFDRMGKIEQGTREAICAVTAQYLAEGIRSLSNTPAEGETK